MWRIDGPKNYRVFTLRLTLSLVAALTLFKVPALEALSFGRFEHAELASAKTEPTTAELHSVPAAQSRAVPGDQFIDRVYHGYYSDERVQLHEKILNELLARGARTRSPRVLLTSGAFGAGKTSTLNKLKQQQLLNLDEFVVIDMDEIRERLPEFAVFNRENAATASQRTQLESGYIAELLIWRAVREKKNILIDSSLSNVDFFGDLLEMIAAQESAYKGRFQLLHVRADLATLQERVAKRNAEALRFTLPQLVKEKYESSVQALERILPKFDTAVVIDNTGAEPRAVFHQKKTKDGKFKTRGLNLSISDLRSRDKDSSDLFTNVSNAAQARPPNHGYDVFIDLDWTILYSIKNPPDVPADELIVYAGARGPEFYRFTDHAAQLIEGLLTLPDVRISFFSGGDKERNAFLLSKIRLSDGRTALEAAAHVFSREHLTMVSTDPQLSFAKRFKKRVQGLIPDIDMTRAILLDDLPEFATEGLRVMFSYGRLTFHNTFDPARVGQRYEAHSALEFERERNKAVLALNVIKTAYEADRSGQAVFSDEAERLLRDPDTGAWLPLTSDKLTRFFKPLSSPASLSNTDTNPQKNPHMVPGTCQKVFGTGARQ